MQSEKVLDVNQNQNQIVYTPTNRANRSKKL